MVSRRLSRLEGELGTQLLTRNTRGAALTEAGTTFREYAARVVAEIDAAKETILPAGELRGRLRISAPLSFGPTHIARVLAEMARRHPKLQIQTCYSDQVVDLIAGGYDCAIRLGFLQDSYLIARRVGPIHGTLVASPSYISAHGSPESLEDLSRHEALMQGAESWRFMDGDEVVVIHPQGRFKADNGAALVAGALAGLGIGYLPTGLVQEHIAAGALTPLLPEHPIPTSGIYVVRPFAQHPSKKVRVLTEMLIECFETSS